MQAQQRTVTIGGQWVAWRVRRSWRAKHLRLHVGLHGDIEVVLPRRATMREAECFVRDKEVWVARVLAANAVRRRALPRRSLVSGESLPVLGESRQLLVKMSPDRCRTRVREAAGIVAVAVPHGRPVRPALVRWYRRHAAGYFSARAADFAATLQVVVLRVAITAAKTQWGSCVRERGRIALNWRLLLGPRTVADYVVAHEVAHLKERRHSARFWRIVGDLMPDYEAQRMWLKSFGYTLEL